MKWCCLIILIYFLNQQSLDGQTDIILQDIVVGHVEVSAPGSVTLKPGFHAVAGSNFRAYIGAVQGQNSSTTITYPDGNNTPASGSQGINYLKEITYREAKTSEPTGNFKHLEQIQYFDGLGRPLQAVQVGSTPLGNDLIQPFFYDKYGRDSVSTFPYTASRTGEFRTGVTISTVNNYYSSTPPAGKESDNRAFTSFIYENSPLNRIVSQTGPGSDWVTQSRSVSTGYLTNTSAKPGWSVTGDYSYSPFNYAVNTLYVIELTDEEGNKTREYKDKLGQIVLKESLLESEWLRTAYIYDDFGLLRCVVPPEATDPNTDTGLCYYYKYNNRNLQVEKKIAGGGIIKMVYDKRDRLRCTQNSLQASSNEWSFIKYDVLNRPVQSGILSNCSSGPDAIKTALDSYPLNESESSSQYSDYTNVSFPTSDIGILSETYYDDYDFIDNISSIVNKDSLKSVTYDNGDYIIQSNLASNNRNRVTGSMIKVFSDPEDLSVIKKSTLFNSTYYDKYGNVLRTVSENHLKGKDVLTNIYEDIIYLVTRNEQEHHKGSENIYLEKWYEYDHTGRLMATREKINNQPAITLSAPKYNEVGEMITKYLHSNQTSGTRSFIQKEDFEYNIRGWLTKINEPGLSGDNDVYGVQLFYNSVSGLGGLQPGTGLYNGNIVGIKWGTKNEPVLGYQFNYDDLNRMLQGNYAQGSTLNSNTGYNSETISEYDKNGNIKGLQRKYNNTVVDGLTYSYTTKTNQISSVSDNGSATSEIDDYPGNSSTYTYDGNGNMTFDGGKNISIEYYRTLNLPQELNFGSNNRVFYHYTTSGIKLSKHNSGASGPTHYIGNIVYEGNNLSYILTEEGRIVPFGTGSDRIFTYEYNLKDHLGDNRVTFMGTDLGGAVDVVQATSYYPFGLVMNQTNGNTEPDYQKNKYLYNGKELQDEQIASVSLEWYDYHTRFYDPQIGRWHVVDPLAEKAYDWSPYRYGFCNPIIYTDPFGLYEDWYQDKEGNIEYDPNVKTQADVDKKGGGKYLGEEFKTDYAKFNKNGTALFYDETKAYNYLYDRADRHNVEGGSFITTNGVLILPDYLNTEGNTKIDEYNIGFTKKSIHETGNITLGGKDVKSLGLLHTHQWNGLGMPPDPKPSRYDPSGKGTDLDISRYWNSMPILTISWDNDVWMLQGSPNSDKWTLQRAMAKDELLKGKLGLIGGLKTLPSYLK